MLQSTALKSEFLLDPSVTFLNFGSFGACPRPVFERYQRYQLELETEPVQFIAFKGTAYLEASRKVLGTYLNCDKDDLVYVTNPSYAVNIVAKGLNLQAGDEVLTSDLEYGACDKTWAYYCEKSGARLVRQKINLPLRSKEQFLEDVFSGVSERTRVIFLSHITSTTALVFPVAEVCALARKRGILTFIDGAHAPGQIPLDLGALDADIYTGACHKWMLAPKGCSFFYAKKEVQHYFDPLVVSWGYNSSTPSASRFIDYHQNQGTRDFSAFLCTAAAIDFMNRHNWTEVAAQCRALVRRNAARFATLLNTQLLCEAESDFLAQMLSLEIQTKTPELLQAHLYNHYKIEIPVMRHGNRCYIRFSVNAFNSQHDLDRLYQALSEIKHAKKLMDQV